jgi:hypothetical protein
MTRVKDTVKNHLEYATAWLSTNDVAAQLKISGSSAGRALRRLRADGVVANKKLANDRFGRMQWISTLHLNSNFSDATTPTNILYVRKTAATPKTKQLTLPAGDLKMQIKMAVDVIVTEWVKANKAFSAHDVTVELRHRVNSGALQVDPGLAGTAKVGGKDVTNIEHAIVKEIVEQMWSDKDFLADRKHNGTYFTYDPNISPPSASPAPAADDGTNYDGNSTL